MNPTELYNLWAPKDSIWTNWAKPVLFADSAYDELQTNTPADWRSQNLPWAPAPDSGSAIVLDLPGSDSVKVALALTQKGFRPVPLFNGAAGRLMGGPTPLIETYPLMCALHAAAGDLAGLRRNSAGGFGAIVPEPSSSGGYG